MIFELTAVAMEDVLPILALCQQDSGQFALQHDLFQLPAVSADVGKNKAVVVRRRYFFFPSY